MFITLNIYWYIYATDMTYIISNHKTLVTVIDLQYHMTLVCDVYACYTVWYDACIINRSWL